MINTHQLVSRVPLLGEQRFVCGLPVGKTERRVPLLGEQTQKEVSVVPLLGEQRFVWEVSRGLWITLSNNPGTVVLL